MKSNRKEEKEKNKKERLRIEKEKKEEMKNIMKERKKSTYVTNSGQTDGGWWVSKKRFSDFAQFWSETMEIQNTNKILQRPMESFVK